LVVPEIENPFYTTVSRGVEDVANATNYAVMLCNTDEEEDKQERYLHALLERKIDGILFVPCGKTAIDHCADLDAAEVPFVLVDREVPGTLADTVVGDNLGGARDLTQHLVALGHRRIALIGGNPVDSVSQGRLTGYRTALQQVGIEPDPQLVREGDWDLKTGLQSVHQLLSLDQPPSALFCTNNAIAVGALLALRELSRRVPEDVALVCFDDIELASLIDPFLTVAVQPAYEMGRRAAVLLLDRIAGRLGPTPIREVLPTKLIIRRSCGVQAAPPGPELHTDGWLGRRWAASV
jgi:LacI family transcriptional regulator